MDKQITIGLTKNYRFHWQYSCAFTKWIPSNQFMHSGKTYNPATMTLERFGFIGMDKKCFWGMVGVDWVTPLKITQIKPGKEGGNTKKPKPPAPKPKPKPVKKFNYDGTMVAKCPAKAVIFTKTDPKYTFVNWDTTNECHDWKNFYSKDKVFKMRGFKWAKANAYSGRMYAKRTKDGKYYGMDADDFEGKGGDKQNDKTGPWHSVAKAFCKKMGLPWKSAI
jgi:hypothetical protein